MLIKALESQRKMLVVRKVTATLRDSIFAEFQSAISKFGLSDKCKIVSSLLTIELPNGSQLIFKGLDDSEKIKSIAGISLCPL
ncbi:MAG: phage terminase large subunit [Clostridium sp.]|nr:phage terminase large subunit [Clostridium sp.]